MNIGFLDEPPEDYAKAITGAATVETLRAAILPFKRIASDALEAAEAMTAEDFKAWLKGLKSERRGKFAGEEWCNRFGMILMPATMLVVSSYAMQFKAPWGVTFMRMKEAGRIVEAGGVAKVIPAASAEGPQS